MTALETFLRTSGLWALFFAAATEGDLTLLLTGMLIHLGIWRALPVGAAGGLERPRWDAMSLKSNPG